ncbi:heme NO-binding domain-containing protein [Flavobacterium psychrotrophum]|uniref:heme NO-binding domain-containing protein n=1 Tax=Flavobacterium psychrotrophum TaxID=2294119 RepID=UPI000E31069B|nr:heme NO-binding domain-containing protein [Flavobacterium psychrotrophum]
MYGVIYVAIKDYAEEQLGPEKWEAVLSQSGVTVDFTVTEQPYNDTVTYKLAKAIAAATEQSFTYILYNIGKQVILTTNKKFNNIMSSRGGTLREYLINLPNYHNRISLIYPELTPPEFRVSDTADSSLVLHYRKRHPEMLPYVEGYVNGLATIFNESVVIEPQPDTDTNTELSYKISW